MIRFDIPLGMAWVDIAKAFAAYIQGPLAFENGKDANGQFRWGPYQKETDADWQLDASNDFFLHFRENNGTLNYRYPGQEPVARAAVALFEARFQKKNKKAEAILHHADPPCDARLENGFCPKCKFVPDMQSTCFHLYCPTCKVPLEMMVCPKCQAIFEPPT